MIEPIRLKINRRGNKPRDDPAGVLTPKKKNASQVPINGIDCKMPRMICRPVPEQVTAGSRETSGEGESGEATPMIQFNSRACGTPR